MEDPPEELSDADDSGVLERALALGDRIRDVTLTQPDAGEWFAMWKPVVGAVIRLAKTLGKLLLHLRKLGTADEPIEPMGEELRAELAEDLADITADFPDIADVLFGLGNIDIAYDALKSDENARSLARSLADASIGMLDRFLDTVVDVVLGERESPLRPERIVEAVERYEHVAQRLLDRWLLAGS